MARIESVERLREVYKAPSERAVAKQLSRLDRHCKRFIELSPFVLLATYGVAAAVLQARIESLARAEDLDAEAVAAKLEEEGLGAGLMQQIARALAVLAPFLAGGPVASIIDMLTY